MLANHREFRRKVYFERLLSGELRQDGTPIASFDEDGDQVLLVPGRLNVEGSSEDEAVRAISADLGDRYDVKPVRETDEQRPPRKADNAQKLGLNRKDDNPVDAEETVRVVRELAAKRRKGRVAPEYVFLTQQKVHPGEDPEGATLAPVPPGRDHLGRGVRVVVIDTGLADNTTSGASCVDQIEDRDALLGGAGLLGPAAGHGTFISALIKAIGPGTDVRNIKVADPMGACTESAVVKALLRAAEGGDGGPLVINLSLGMHGLRISDEGAKRETQPPIDLGEAVKQVLAMGDHIAIVASAGNSDSTDPMYPAAFPDVVGVAALERGGRRWPLSNRGPWVDASALGHRLRAEYVEGDEDPDFDPDGSAERFTKRAEWSGTSFAAPLVTAQIAIVAAAGRISARHAQQIVLGSASPAIDPGCGVWVRPFVPGNP